jgi:hypothetical protein
MTIMMHCSFSRFMFALRVWLDESHVATSKTHCRIILMFAVRWSGFNPVRGWVTLLTPFPPPLFFLGRRRLLACLPLFVGLLLRRSFLLLFLLGFLTGPKWSGAPVRPAAWCAGPRSLDPGHCELASL